MQMSQVRGISHLRPDDVEQSSEGGELAYFHTANLSILATTDAPSDPMLLGLQT
jgi:hypothetical protein